MAIYDADITYGPRAAIIREAVAEYLERRTLKSIGSAFGLWGRDGTDGVAYQQQARAEW